ncbi:protein of unknown function [Burkholderia multivorans]
MMGAGLPAGVSRVAASGHGPGRRARHPAESSPDIIGGLKVAESLYIFTVLQPFDPISVVPDRRVP